MAVCPPPQAKTTKKIVLRLQCQSCRQVSQHPIKVRAVTRRALGSSSPYRFGRLLPPSSPRNNARG